RLMALALAYCLILAEHFAYALWAIRTRAFSLEIGKIRSARVLLFGLLFLNGISLSAFFLDSIPWAWVQVALHLALIVDEAIRMRRVPARVVFLGNHVLFAGLLALRVYGLSIIATSV